MSLPQRAGCVRTDDFWKAVVKKDVAVRTVESIHGMNVCHAWPRHCHVAAATLQRSRVNDSGALPAVEPTSRQPKEHHGHHFSETTSHGLILGNQPKLIPLSPCGPLKTMKREAKAALETQAPETKAGHPKAEPAEMSFAPDIWDDRLWGKYQT
mmetsp:Transcript_6051/g.11021  ORF Transcript_6051/g.11021 Transcript_6051/m.11021 type:complete len:154 (-) Transcript_6051:46-507(-)